MEKTSKESSHGRKNEVVESLPEQDPARAKEQTEQMLKAFKESPDRSQARLMKNGCVHCGFCTQACHYYLSTGDPQLIPSVKAEKLSAIIRQYANPARTLLSLTKPQPLGPERKRELHQAAYEHCTLCGRCSLSCPMGLNTRKTMYAARSMFASIGEIPSGLDEPVETAIKTGNYIGMSTEDFVENMEWTGEELGDELELEEFSVPVDKEGAETLYVPHPLEVRDYPLLLMATIKVLHAAGENYTFSSHCFDVTNYAFYQGSREKTAAIIRRMLQAAEKLQVKRILLTPCGHGYRVMRWEAEKVLGSKLPVPVTTMAEFLDHILQNGRIQVEKDVAEGPFTYHDPCNIGRLGGVVEEPRSVLNTLTSQFVEMEPHGVRSFCCGGGGGLSATGDYGQTRIQAGKAKVDQILQTGAKVVATGCYNCMTQIKELNRVNKMGVEVKSIVELVADALKI